MKLFSKKVALAVILIRAGLGLDPAALRRLSLLVLRLAALPSVAEAGALAVAAWLLLGLPWLWGLLAGAVMAAVSPAVVIPALFRLQSRGYGTEKGIPTLVVASASFDDILAVTTFGVTHSVLFADGRPWENALHGLLAVPMGLAFGAAWGALARVVPRHSDVHAAPLRSLLVAGGGLLAVLGSDAIGYDGAGPLGAILAAFVACHGWRQQGYTDKDNPVARHFCSAWGVFQTLLFAFIGAENDMTQLDPRAVGLCTGALLIALAVRIAFTVLIAFGAGLTWKEKLFVSFAWLPKATVQGREETAEEVNGDVRTLPALNVLPPTPPSAATEPAAADGEPEKAQCGEEAGESDNDKDKEKDKDRDFSTRLKSGLTSSLFEEKNPAGAERA